MNKFYSITIVVILCHIKSCAATCANATFSCSNGRCIPLNYYCDQYNDCGDWSDEDKCKNASSCHSPHFWCSLPERCIKNGYLCNGDNDCGDWSDEQNCGSEVPTLAWIGITFSLLFVLVLVVVMIARFVIRNKEELPCFSGDSTEIRERYARGNPAQRQNSSEENDGEEGRTRYLTPVPIEDRPPNYYRAMNHPDQFPRPDYSRNNSSYSSNSNQPTIEISTISSPVNRQIYRDASAHPPPPSYDAIISGQYVEITTPSAEEVHRVRREMVRRSQSTDQINNEQNTTQSTNQINNEQNTTQSTDQISNQQNTTGATRSLNTSASNDESLNTSAYSNQGFVDHEEVSDSVTANTSVVLSNS